MTPNEQAELLTLRQRVKELERTEKENDLLRRANLKLQAKKESLMRDIMVQETAHAAYRKRARIWRYRGLIFRCERRRLLQYLQEVCGVSPKGLAVIRSGDNPKWPDLD